MRSQSKTPFAVSPAAYHRNLTRLVREALAEDVGAGDATTAALALRGMADRTSLYARENGILAGADAFEAVMRTCARRSRIVWHCRDGKPFRRGARIVTVTGTTAPILTGERTAINFIAHLSGVATATRRMVDRIPRGTARLLDTRKTTPGWRLLEKRATQLGGALNHRIGLYDAIMIKDNHIAACGDLETALRRANTRRTREPLICEVRNLREIRTALKWSVGWLLLDNFSPARLRRAVRVIREFQNEAGRRIIIEASGGITLRTINAVARTGVDFISAGAITHSAPAIDFSLKWVH